MRVIRNRKYHGVGVKYHGIRLNASVVWRQMEKPMSHFRRMLVEVKFPADQVSSARATETHRVSVPREGR